MTLRITYHRNTGPNQIQAPQGEKSNETALAIGAETHTAAVADACLAEMSCDAICAISTGLAAVADASNSQRLPAGAYGYFRWLSAGDRVSVISTT
jgi:hypothetical protein